MEENFISRIREALDMQTATANELCERILTLRQIEICAFYLQNRNKIRYRCTDRQKRDTQISHD